jgi:hypothetical protein
VVSADAEAAGFAAEDVACGVCVVDLAGCAFLGRAVEEVWVSAEQAAHGEFVESARG